MKTEQEIDALMARIPADWRNNWCKAERCSLAGWLGLYL